VGFELKRKLDYSDLQVTPDDGRRYELVEGELLVSPSPTPMHQTVCGQLFLQLVAYFHTRKLGTAFIGPVDVILTGHDVLVPDLLVTIDPSHISKRGIEKPPLLVVEVLSPSTRRLDLGAKSRRYAELGVEHYWIVDPEARRLKCYRSVDRVFQPVVEAEGDAPLAHPAWDGLNIELRALWS
jgi:Uma2 family endonuclease